ncbi:MAG: RNA polymerase sigma-70 factor [Sphingobacteriales bacterium]|nr:RNA polymerase sigma-70 factor [Sphingobacteriales bacterium]
MMEYQLYDNGILMGLVCKGDEAAFTELYNRYWKKLFAMAYSRLKEMQTAEDIVHDVFVSLWANREKINIELLENYLATAVKYMVLSRIKKIERERAYKRSYGMAAVIEMPVENALHYKRILELVETEVEKLPEKCRLIFRYSRQNGMPVKHIARELNISPKTVENQLNKALKQLKMAAKTFLHLF